MPTSTRNVGKQLIPIDVPTASSYYPFYLYLILLHRLVLSVFIQIAKLGETGFKTKLANLNYHFFSISSHISLLLPKPLIPLASSFMTDQYHLTWKARRLMPLELPISASDATKRFANIHHHHGIKHVRGN